MTSIVFVAVAAPLLVFVVVSCLGFFGDRVRRKQFAIRDMFILLTIIAVVFGIIAVILRSTPL